MTGAHGQGLPVLLVTGAAGQVGAEFRRQPGLRAFRLNALDRAALDIGDAEAVSAAVATIRPDVVVNAAAYTAVDKAESEPERAFAVNRDGAAHLARACAARGVPLIHISTDYVFDGAKDGPWREDDPIGPLGAYGASKAAGEAAVRESWDRHVIVRASWIYGALGPNFVRTMLRLGATRDRLTVVDDQWGRPTEAGNLAAALLTVAGRVIDGGSGAYGTFHYSGGGEPTSWHGFARAVFDRVAARGGRVPEVAAIPSRDYPSPIRRPANSVLDTTRFQAAFGVAAPPWRESLRGVLAELLTPAIS
ncbi:dTDP-4-dehydrorhamnose reductase [Azospirillum sp.]|uniref:dTDP-4-dehydrorhamnose reductase n=1 Tax=Azospirillum sp. TaxID=34012 RepID=UPI002D506ABF|nr:dTDP-4-dehydrorhamnose reductase [Azospirillum sp.]HYD64532.1 dTDP-4-dehydrorhamnose reductase [Azospirillum sp.]